MSVYTEMAKRIAARMRIVTTTGEIFVLIMVLVAAYYSFSGKHDLAAECLLWGVIFFSACLQIRNGLADKYNDLLDMAEKESQEKKSWADRMRETYVDNQKK